MRIPIIFYLVGISLFAGGEPPREPLVIGTRVAPPFVLRTEQGTWSGLSVDLWREITSELGLDYQFKEVSIQEMTAGVDEGRIDAGVGALTITAEREQRVDFTHPFHTSGLGIAIREAERSLNWVAVIGGFFSPAFLAVLLTLALVLLVTGLGVWLFERKKNASQFGGSAIEGVGSGFWWSAVTMTTVGYGDKTPITAGGKIISLIWMFTSVIIISSFTASIASSLTVSSMDSPIKGPSDLVRYKVAAIEGSTSTQYLLENGVRFTTFPSLPDALEALHEGSVDAAVHDRPMLQYFARMTSGLEVLPQAFQRQDYGISLPSESPLRQDINIILLERISSKWWLAEKQRYLGGE